MGSLHSDTDPARETSAGQERKTLRGSADHATIMLVVVTLFWGLSFPLSKSWLNAGEATTPPGGKAVAGLTLISVRTVLGLVLLACWQPRLFTAPSWRELGAGWLIGCINCLACIIQVWGLAETTPALSVFLTSLASAWVPLVAFLCFRIHVPPLTLVGLGLGILGAMVLALQPELDWTFGKGEWLTILCSVMFAIVIVLVDRFGRKARSGHLSVGFLAGSGLPAVMLLAIWAGVADEGRAWLPWTLGMHRNPDILTSIVVLTVFATVLSLHWMSVYQPRVAASRAALIYLLEPVFGSILSVMWGYDEVSQRLLAGGGLILGGNLLVEFPVWLRDRRRSRDEG